MFVDVLERKGFDGTFLCVEADRDSLHGPDIVDRTFLVEVRQRDMAAGFIDADRGDRGWDFLDQGQLLLAINLIAVNDHVLQCGAAQTTAFPGAHLTHSFRKDAKNPLKFSRNRCSKTFPA